MEFNMVEIFRGYRMGSALFWALTYLAACHAHLDLKHLLHLAAVFDAILYQYKYAIAMDFTNAFGTVHIELLHQNVLKALPPDQAKWLLLLLFHWRDFFVARAKHTHDTSLNLAAGLPQGDPSSPLMRALLVKVGYDRVQAALGANAILKIVYMDDRLVFANSNTKSFKLNRFDRNSPRHST